MSKPTEVTISIKDMDVYDKILKGLLEIYKVGDPVSQNIIDELLEEIQESGINLKGDYDGPIN